MCEPGDIERPLLENAAGKAEEDSQSLTEERDWPISLAGEFKAVALLATPLVLSNIIDAVNNVIDNIFIGNLGSDELAATSLAWTYMLACYMLPLGMSQGVSILAAQAVGAKDSDLAALWLLRGLLLCFAVGAPIIVAWIATGAPRDTLAYYAGVYAFKILRDIQVVLRMSLGLLGDAVGDHGEMPWGVLMDAVGVAGQVMVALGAAPHLVHLGQQFAYHRMIGTPASIILSCIAGWLSAYEITMPQVMASTVSILINIPANYVLIHGAPMLGWDGLGFVGSPLATSIS
eukprot:gene15490-18343_t